MTWTARRIEHLASEVRVTVDPGIFGDDDVDHYSIPALEASGGPERQPASEIHSQKLRLAGGELLLSRLNPRKARVLTVPPLDGHPAIASGEFVVLRPDNIEPRFLEYLLLSETIRQTLDGAVQSVTRSHQRIRPEQLLKLTVAVPVERAVQGLITRFLDIETAQIDALLAKKRRIVELLDERWLTSCAASTGVRGDDPEGQLVQLRRVADLQAGAAFPHQHQGDLNGAIPYVKVGDLAQADEGGHITSVANRVSAEIAAALRSPVLPTGTIVLPKIGAALLTNRRAVLSEPSCLDQNVMGVTVRLGSPKFVQYCLESIDLGALSAPGPVPLLNEDAARSVRIPWPPVDSQQRIAADLEARQLTHRKTRRSIVTQIELLREHRQALITAAVTGEMEVPGVAA